MRSAKTFPCIFLTCFIFPFLLFSQSSPISIELIRTNFATFRNELHPDNHIGYRFFEHAPLEFGNVPLSTMQAGYDPQTVATLEDSFSTRQGVVSYKRDIETKYGWIEQKWNYYLVPVSDGVDILLTVETFGRGLPEYYGVQQCFRMSGETNEKWRKEIACTPAFSEYDLWATQGDKKASLTYVQRGEEWSALPAQEKAVGARTPIGLAADFLRTNGSLKNVIGPYTAQAQEPIDSPAIVRTDISGEWVCGIYWQNASHVTNHHPADCLHPIINIGNIPPFSKRAFRGKILWFKGKKESTEQRLKESIQPSGSLRIAACQFPVSGDISENSRWIKQQARKAKMNGAELVHFPECALSGYGGADWNDWKEFDWQVLKQETTSILNLAKELKTWILLGSSHQLSGDNKPHNSIYVINPAGDIIDRYDKRFCTSGDLKYYSPGDHFVNFEINGIKCGLLICYDVRFPELYREYRKIGIDVIFQSFYNARHGENCIHPKIMPVTAQTRAATNAFFMSLTNSSAPYSWPCHFITPDGLIQQKLPANKPGILYADIDATKKFYDASRPFRLNAIDGKLNSGETVIDTKSQNRKNY
jgi:deaminated glutathione amidase